MPAPPHRAVSAGELLEGLAALPGAVDGGARDPKGSQVVAGVEFVHADGDERGLRAAYKRRRGSGGRPLILVTDTGEDGFLRALGPQ